MFLNFRKTLLLASSTCLACSFEVNASASEDNGQKMPTVLIQNGMLMVVENHIVQPKVKKKKLSPIKAITAKYNEDAKKIDSRQKHLLTRLEAIMQNEDAGSLDEFNAEILRNNLVDMFDSFQKIHLSDAVIGEKRDEALKIEKNLSSLESEVTKGEGLLRKILKSKGRKGISTSAEALLRQQELASKNENSAREVKENAKNMLAAEKQTRQIKLTRPGAHGSNAVDRDEQRATHEANSLKQRPYKDVKFEKLAKGKVPPAAMDTVVLIRNIFRKCRDKAQVIEELKNFEKDINLKEVEPAYVGLNKNAVDNVYQLKINDRFRVIFAFTAGTYVTPKGKQVDIDLLYENTLWVLDPHK